MQRISETAKGRWHGILPQLGISYKLLRNRHGPCPMCGGKDRFRFDDRDGRGTWICNRCGSGDGAELVKRVKGVEFKEAAKMIEGVAGNTEFRKPNSVKKEPDIAKLYHIWNESKFLMPGDPVAEYLGKRCGLESGQLPHCLRSWRQNTMIALVSDGTGQPVSLHRTHVLHGTKVMMAGKLPDNVSIKFHKPSPQGLGIAEGIETALSASILFDVPVWAAISAPLLKKWRPPMGVQKVIIFGDNDENFAGQEAAYSLARALSGNRDGLEVEVKIPSIPGWDWNDVHRNNLDNR